MALYSGAPSIRIEGDEQRALALIPEAKQLLATAQGIAKRAGVPTYSMQRQVDEESYIYVLVANGVNIIQISVAPQVPDKVNPAPEQPEVPATISMLSGVVFDGRITSFPKVGAKPGTPQTYKAVTSWQPTPLCARLQKLPTGRGPSTRLLVKPDPTFIEWNPGEGSTQEWSQYEPIRASIYSGTMAKVVQVLMGLGHINVNTLRAVADINLPKTTYQNKVLGDGVQISFDYKFNRTHGITFGADGKPWLIEISSGRGVLGMPLPCFPNTQTAGAAQRARNAGDEAMARAIEECGGLPTGQGFPSSPKELAAKIASGDILQLATANDIGDFYKLSGYSTACGWAFSANGKEAHNVGYYYPDGGVVQHGCWYQISINIGAIKTQREKNEPIAVGSASLRLQQEGQLFSPIARISFMPIKYYEPLLPGLLSHSAKPLGPNTGEVYCDTVVYVAFMDNDLKTCRFYLNSKSQPFNVVTDDRQFGECLYDGSWTWTVSTGNHTLPSMPYTNDIDPRSILEDHFETSTLTSNSVGFDPPIARDFIEAPSTCRITRIKVFKETLVTETSGGESRGGMFIVPGGSREAYYFFEAHSYNGGRSGNTSISYTGLQDPNVYYGWRKFPLINPPPWPGGWGCDASLCGINHTDRRVICWVFEDIVCGDFADSGQWANQCDSVEALTSGRAPNRPSSSTPWNKGTDFSGTWNLFSANLGGPRSGSITSTQAERAFAPSPDPESDIVQNISAIRSTIGEDCVIYSKGFDDGWALFGTPAVPINAADGMPAFIGVNV